MGYEEHLREFNFGIIYQTIVDFRWRFRENRILIERLNKSDTLLEVGCATGTMQDGLKTIKDRNIEYLGVDSDTAI